MDDVFCEEDSLELDEEKVDELFKILEDGLNGLFRDGVVLAGWKELEPEGFFP